MQKSFPSCESVTIENSRAKFHWLYVCMMLEYSILYSIYTYIYMCVCVRLLIHLNFSLQWAPHSARQSQAKPEQGKSKQQAKVNNGTSNFTEISEFVIKREPACQ